jgi:hypothetical protein
MPVEIKVMGMFLALQARYSTRLACVGFRSGSLDGAAFLGIPTFSLDNVVIKERARRIKSADANNITNASAYKRARKYWRQVLSPGTYLWNPSQYGCHILLPKGGPKFERMENMSRYMNSFVEIHLTCVLDGAASVKTERLSGDNGLSHLKAAVAVYLCTDAYGAPRWLRRLDSMANGTAQLQRIFGRALAVA